MFCRLRCVGVLWCDDGWWVMGVSVFITAWVSSASSLTSLTSLSSLASLSSPSSLSCPSFPLPCPSVSFLFPVMLFPPVWSVQFLVCSRPMELSFLGPRVAWHIMHLWLAFPWVDENLFTAHPSEKLHQEYARLSALENTTLKWYNAGEYGDFSQWYCDLAQVFDLYIPMFW